MDCNWFCEAFAASPQGENSFLSSLLTKITVTFYHAFNIPFVMLSCGTCVLSPTEKVSYGWAVFQQYMGRSPFKEADQCLAQYMLSVYVLSRMSATFYH